MDEMAVTMIKMGPREWTLESLAFIVETLGRITVRCIDDEAEATTRKVRQAVFEVQYELLQAHRHEVDKMPPCLRVLMVEPE